jgi:type VI secretion system protein ImpF
MCGDKNKTGARAGTAIGTPRRANSHLLPTLLDRLQDAAPHRSTEAFDEFAITRSQMRDILQRDLAFLLNTTSIEDQIDRVRYPEAAASTVNFGVPPLAGQYLASRKWVDLETAVRRAISDFEPRLMPDTLAVTPLNAAGTRDSHNVLMFEISGMVHMDPYPMEFLVQSSIDLETSRMNVAHARARDA